MDKAKEDINNKIKVIDNIISNELTRSIFESYQDSNDKHRTLQREVTIEVEKLNIRCKNLSDELSKMNIMVDNKLSRGS